MYLEGSYNKCLQKFYVLRYRAHRSLLVEAAEKQRYVRSCEIRLV